MSITAKHEFDIRTDCWSGALDRINELTEDQLDMLEDVLQDYFADDVPTDTDINDFIWFEEDTWKPWIGFGEVDEDEDDFEDDFEESFKRNRRFSRKTESVHDRKSTERNARTPRRRRFK